jgi:type I restriction enzyme R subunit
MLKSNFEFLKEHDPIFFQLACTAEKSFASDPNTTLVKLRQLGEAIAQNVAARCGVFFDQTITHADLLYKLEREINLKPEIRELFHTIRIEGNKATHKFRTKHKEAIDGLRIARALSVWYHQSFGKNGTSFRPEQFITPPDPSKELTELQKSIEQLKTKLSEANEKVESNQQILELQIKEKEKFEELAKQMNSEAKVYEEIAKEHELTLQKQKNEFDQKLILIQKELENQKKITAQNRRFIKKAAFSFSPNEELTRIIIDQQLVIAGWEADTQVIKYALGARPEKGKNKAIAEWPTGGGQSADYILFAGLIPIATVEAKRKNVDVAGKIGQAERYAKGFRPMKNMIPAWEVEGQTIAWPDEEWGHYHIPFVYSCNGKPYIKQLEEKSGTWFRDVRHYSNLKNALQTFHTPEGLLDKLKRSKVEAEKKLKQEGFGYLKLRDYQEKAVKAVESELEKSQRNLLIAMATGTGKTRTILGLMYRFLKSERFKRILFLVDRTSLGGQAFEMFNESTLEQNQTLSKIYNIAELGDMRAEAETRIQIATVQSMVRRIFQSEYPPKIDEFDCVIVDEAHRGYTLDQEMTEGELIIRDSEQYISTYRRVLDYFDAVKIGMTATPAKHTTDIFGKPVYTYSYREAVADDWLIDHEPPIRYKTLLSKKGIHFDKGEEVSFVNTKTGEIEISELADELHFEVDSFNRKVIAPKFNKVICEELAKEFDPFGDEKVLIFCVKDLHADMVKSLLDKEFKEIYGDKYNEAAVQKITGKSDKVDTLIKKYKNERYPTIAITVDLLTTGIDVPRICHLAFLRRVNSRILYEQMIGRATRRCDEIGKTVFKIYDPVDIYASLQDVSTMKPLVKDPNITLFQLVDELNDPDSFNTPGSTKETTHAHDVLDAISQKVMRILRKAENKAGDKKEIREKLDELENFWGIEPSKLHKHLKSLGPKKAAEFINNNKSFISQLEKVKMLLGSEYFPLISDEEDKLEVRDQSYGKYEKPEDYIQSFSEFIKSNINVSAALSVVVNRPKDLTRDQLREIKLFLDQNGFKEANINSAWRNKSNHEIAASIIGYIRKAALGTELIPFSERVEKAMRTIYSLTNWSTVQKKWLERLAKQLVHEVVIDEEFVNRAFSKDGGVKQLNKILDNKLTEVIQTLAETLWREAG